MRIIIVFSSPNRQEFDEIWHPLINEELGYIQVNDAGDKIYAFDGHNDHYRCRGVWMTENLINEIERIVNDNENCECACILHDANIPEDLTAQFTDIRFKEYSYLAGPFYDTYVGQFAIRERQLCFNDLWGSL
jgi:hypothetical protein